MIATKLQLANAPSTQEEDIMVDSCKSVYVGVGQSLVVCKSNEVLQKLANNVWSVYWHGLIFTHVDCIHIPKSPHVWALFWAFSFFFSILNDNYKYITSGYFSVFHSLHQEAIRGQRKQSETNARSEKVKNWKVKNTFFFIDCLLCNKTFFAFTLTLCNLLFCPPDASTM